MQFSCDGGQPIWTAVRTAEKISWNIPTNFLCSYNGQFSAQIKIGPLFHHDFLDEALSVITLTKFYFFLFPGKVNNVKLETLVEGDPKALFPIATTPKCRGGRYSIPWIAPLYTWSLLTL